MCHIWRCFKNRMLSGVWSERYMGKDEEGRETENREYDKYIFCILLSIYR